MPESLSRELLTLIDTCNEFVANVMNPAAEHPTDAARALIRAGAKDVGLFPMTQPTDFGGSASSALALCVARETPLLTQSKLFGCGLWSKPGRIGQCEGSFVQLPPAAFAGGHYSRKFWLYRA